MPIDHSGIWGGRSLASDKWRRVHCLLRLPIKMIYPVGRSADHVRIADITLGPGVARGNSSNRKVASPSTWPPELSVLSFGPDEGVANYVGLWKSTTLFFVGAPHSPKRMHISVPFGSSRASFKMSSR